MSVIIGSEAPSDQAAALEIARKIALQQFYDAAKTVTDPPPAEDKTKSAGEREAARTKLADYEKAKREMSAALKLIGETDRQAGQLRVQLTTTAVCKRIEHLMGQETDNPADAASITEINSLEDVLSALAALSPAPNSGSQSGSTSS